MQLIYSSDAGDTYIPRTLQQYYLRKGELLWQSSYVLYVVMFMREMDVADDTERVCQVVYHHECAGCL